MTTHRFDARGEVHQEESDGGRNNPQVAIVGGGPVGLWLGCELALTGVRVTVLEQLTQPTGRSKALGLHARTMEMFEHRGILGRFVEGNSTLPVVNFGMFPLDLRTLDFPHPGGVFIPQARVEERLETHARELGVEILRGHEVTGFEQDERGVTVAVHAANHDYRLSAAYLVGCDGGHSTIRKESGVAFPGAEPTIVGRMGDVQLSANALKMLKENLAELGGRDFGLLRTKTGNFAIVPLGEGIHRVAAIEWEQLLFESKAPLSLDELRAAIQRVIGIDVAMSSPVWLSRATDSSRLAEQYRIGRVFLAGDAAHVHWAYGGMGLQTGLQDAGNLGWKLAAQIRGWAPPDLLDSYHTERHQIGERLLMSTRAQEALARPGDHVTALRCLISELLKNEQTFRHIVEMVTGVEIQYEMAAGPGERHPQLGRWAPNLDLETARGRVRVAELMHSGRGLFLDLGERSALQTVASGWADRVNVVAARCYERLANVDALLVRPDGYVAWVAGFQESDLECQSSLRCALNQWFGVPHNAAERNRPAAAA
jgi:2-polyprenyl-6-methoxyphenol hydroxylase-like FAD-dependent oxidoreductase